MECYIDGEHNKDELQKHTPVLRIREELIDEGLKTGSIIHQFKDEDKQSIANNRLIIRLNSISKVLKTLTFDILYEALHKVVASQEHKFTNYKSMMKQINLYPSEMFKNLDLTTLATLHIDFETAFDKMFQEKLIENLRAMGIASGSQTLLEN
ncbi:uncharacterized protein LOC142341312 [Convolutriloba macropyga]|uniref:uncharacterized protein LOC142341312 n=1 Tax=Convolutriloba macropyga TaxID=536237 RepID=UPI003F52504E